MLDGVMYQELLHRVLGTPETRGRREVHGPAFRAAEGRFPRLEEMWRFISRLTAGQVPPGAG